MRSAIVLFLAIGVAAVSLMLGFDGRAFPGYGWQGDLFARWYGARAAFDGRDPYSAEITAEIQRGYYGHVLRPGEATDQEQFAYPVYVIFLVWPLTRMDFATVRVLTSFLFLFALMATTLLWLAILRWRLPPRERLIAVLLVIGLVPAAQAIRLQQLSVLAMFLISLGVYWICKGRLVWAGVAFALSTVKPQMTLLPLLWMLIWVAAGWRGRIRFAGSFGASLGLLILAGEAVVRGWMPQFLSGLSAYADYSHPSGPMLFIVLGRVGGGLAAAVVMMFLLGVALRHRAADAMQPEFAYVTVLAMAAGVLCLPSLAAPYSQVLLIPAGLMIARLAITEYSSPLRLGLVAAIILPTILTAANAFGSLPQSLYDVTTFGVAFALPICVVAVLMVRASQISAAALPAGSS